jgi:hypothetical protein
MYSYLVRITGVKWDRTQGPSSSFLPDSDRGRKREAEAPLSFSYPFHYQGNGDKGGWSHQIIPKRGEVDKKRKWDKGGLSAG